MLTNYFFSSQPLWTQVATLMAACIIAFELAINTFTFFAQKASRNRYARIDRSTSWHPKCAIIVPTKGIPYNAEANFKSFLVQKNHDYDVFFVVESETDPGVPLIRSVIDGHQRAHLIIAGLTSKGCQQNHNMLAGVAAAKNAEILAFADNDSPLPETWLTTLIAPLQDPAITVTSGYRWIVSGKKGIAAQVHTLLNMGIYAHFSLVARLFGFLLWGGSFALRRKDFDDLNVGPRWAEAVSDDISLSEILVKNKKRSYLIPGFLIMTDDVITSWKDCALWFKRQMLCLKAYQYGIWAMGCVPIFLLSTALYALLPIAAIGSLLTQSSFWNWGGGISLTFLVGEWLIGLTYGLLGPTRNHWLFVMRMHLLRMPMLLGMIWTIGESSMLWAGITYHFNRKGQVIRIER